jgi:hypothetical protein
VGPDGPVPDHHLELIFYPRRDERKPNRFVQGGREGPAGHPPNRLPIRLHGMVVARDPTPLQLEADELLTQPFLLLALEGFLADKLLLLVQVDGEADASLQRGGLGVQLVAVETHPGLEP